MISKISMIACSIVIGFSTMGCDYTGVNGPQSYSYPEWTGPWEYGVSTPYSGGSAALKFDTNGTFCDNIFFVGMNQNQSVTCSGTWRDLLYGKIEKTLIHYRENDSTKSRNGKKDTLIFHIERDGAWHIYEYGFSLSLKRPAGPW